MISATFDFALALLILAGWIALALPLAVLVGKVISLGERPLEQRPGYLPDDTYTAFEEPFMQRETLP